MQRPNDKKISKQTKVNIKSIKTSINVKAVTIHILKVTEEITYVDSE